ncbi:glycerate kinase [Planococcus antarcticus DSM 14505]|uniref:Glycerate kinase n=1 Tax=Planococcus antarcticus DSM 14505 TaxID=1185653 RepID=A0AA87IKI0_9BACL|nr:glycerate kinase [Planococcus antarcticus]EIM06321.1 glycerate kinase [Planococcus antarcticus DSM 14505]
MKILIAPDSFKGSMTAIEAAEAMAGGIQEASPQTTSVMMPIADGGEGTMAALVSATGGKLVGAIVEDPLGRKITASYGVLGDQKTCVVELAEASGLTLLTTAEQNPLLASTYGTGELIAHALDAGYRKFIIGLGGSATNDAGIGMLQALGMKFLDIYGVELGPGTVALNGLSKIDLFGFDKRIMESRFLIASDVENPLIGPQGASAVFGPQKGATPEMVKTLDAVLTNFADLVERFTGMALHHKKGAGAAGGAGGAFQAFFLGEMRLGIDLILEAMNFEEQLLDADLVLTGEGKTDAQTLSGKAPFGIAEAANRHGKPVILISGTIAESDKEQLTPYFTEIHAVADEKISAEESIANAYSYVKIKTEKVIESYLKKQGLQ